MLSPKLISIRITSIPRLENHHFTKRSSLVFNSRKRSRSTGHTFILAKMFKIPKHMIRDVTLF